MMSRDHATPYEPELSIPLPIDRIPLSGLIQTIVATPTQRTALADRFGLLELSTLTAELHIHRANNGPDIKITGHFDAHIIQQCVMTLEPMPSHIHQDIAVTYMPAPPHGDAEEGMIDLAPDEDDVEILEGNVIDLGELVAQNLGVTMDPYPRKEGTSPLTAQLGDTAPVQNPFIRLADWPKKPKNTK